MATRHFVELPLDKHAWSPSPFPGQVVLVTSRDRHGAIDIAPKSWISMAAFSGPVIGFGCNTAHATFTNISSTAEYVINVPGVSLAERVWQMLESHGDERLTRSGLTLGSARTVAAPVILDCAAYLECRLRDVVEFDAGEVFVFGTIAAVAVDEGAVEGDAGAASAAIAPFFFVQDGWYAPLGRARRVRHR